MASKFRNEKVTYFSDYRVYTVIYIFVFYRYDDKYTLYITRKSSTRVREASATKSCAHYMDSNGIVFENLVSNEVARLINSLNNEKKDKWNVYCVRDRFSDRFHLYPEKKMKNKLKLYSNIV